MSDEVPQRRGHLARTSTENDKPYDICGARNRNGGICGNHAGKGTDHLGLGRCKFHGGMKQSPLSTGWKQNQLSSIRHPAFLEKVKQLEGDTEVFDLRSQVIQLKAIAELSIENENIPQAQKAIFETAKIVKILHEIEVGRRYVISIENISVMMSGLREVIFRHVPDPQTRARIAADIASIQLSTGEGRLIEGEVVEDEEEST